MDKKLFNNAFLNPFRSVKHFVFLIVIFNICIWCFNNQNIFKKSLDYISYSIQKMDAYEENYIGFQNWLKAHDEKKSYNDESNKIVKEMSVDQQVYQYTVEKKLQDSKVEIKEDVSYKNAQDNFIVHIGYWGDLLSAISSIVALFFSSVALVFVYLTFINEKDRAKQQRFEDRFFRLLEIHRANFNSIVIDKNNGENYEGAKAFLKMFRELMAIYETLNIKKNIWLDPKYSFSNLQRMEIAYLCFFIGGGTRSRRTLAPYLKKYKAIKVKKLMEIITDEEVRGLISSKAGINYKALGGHQSRLGHYFRNLYFCVTQVDESKILTEAQKKEYVKHLRVQLNNYEQIILLLNSLSDFGSEWGKYIYKYQLVKNIPYQALEPNTELNIEDIIRNYKNSFESQKNCIEKFICDWKDEEFEYQKHLKNEHE